jgi:uncharacterized protein (DUF885 family)
MRATLRSAFPHFTPASLGALALVLGATFGCSPAEKPAEAPMPVVDAAPPPATAQVVDASVPPPPPENPDDEAIARAEKDFVDMVARLWPENATTLGLHDKDDELDPRDQKGWDKALDEEDRMLAQLRERFKAPKASKTARINLEIMEHWLALNIRYARTQRPLQRYPSIYNSPMNALFLMTARDYAPADVRARNVVARLEKIPAIIASAKQNLLNPPKVWTQVGIEEARAAKSFFDDIKPFLVTSLPNDKPRVEAALKGAIKAYDDYAKYLATDVMKRSNGGYAAGRELFDFMLREDFGIEDNADQILATGKKVFADTDAQMTEVARRLDPKAKGWPEVIKKLKGNHPKADDLLSSYRTEVLRAKKYLADKDAIAFPPGDDLDVIDTPPFQRSTVTAAYDQPPPFDKVTKGFFFVTPVDKTLSKQKQEEMLRESDHGDLVDTSVHEAYPGHHLQLSFARLHPSPARRVSSPSVFAEGWALYSEELMNELGYYTDEERMLQLEWTLVRAARIIIDVGLHTQGMSFDDGVKILTDKVHLEHELAVSEVKRYTTSPTQPSSYLIGREAIFKLRERYKQKMGDKYLLKSFHTEALSHGTVAPGMLGREMFD